MKKIPRLKTKKKNALLLILTVILTFGVCSQAMADPPILPPNPPAPPPSVFCFGVTGANALGTGGIVIQFEILNWTDELAYDIQLTLDTRSAVTTGGSFGAPAPAPFGGILPNRLNVNDWTVVTSNTTFVKWVAGTPLGFIDLDPNDDNDFSDVPTLPSPLDSGANTLDGFVLVLPDFDVGERIVFNWELTDINGDRILDDNGGFAFGVFQLDRATDGAGGEVRLNVSFSIGTESSAIPDNPDPVDLVATDLNAQTIAPIVPEPGSLFLLGSGLVALTGWARKRERSPKRQ